GHYVLYAIGFRLTAASDYRRPVGSIEGNHTHWPTAQALVAGLFNRGKEAVKIQIEPFNGLWFPHDGVFLMRTKEEHPARKRVKRNFVLAVLGVGVCADQPPLA